MGKYVYALFFVVDPGSPVPPHRAGVQSEPCGRLPASQAVNLLPIVQRELLVSAKSRRVFRLRMAMAAGATLLGLVTIVGWMARGGGRTGGDGLFGFLSGLCWLVCCLSGVFLTADCLSREKREGTLGLLFLTDLRSVDIVLGKLASTSLMTVLMVIGGFPVLALCVLMGGVSGGELFRTCAALLLTMLFSLSLGMLVSTFVRESGQASGATFFLLLLAVMGIPAVTNVAEWLSSPALEAVLYLNYLSPTFLFGTARAAPGVSNQFLEAAGGTALASLALLAIAAFYVRYTWQDRPRAQTTRHHPAAATAVSQSVFRKRTAAALDQNPVLWLVGPGVGHGRWLAIAAGSLIVVLGFTLPRMMPAMLQALPALNSYVLPYLLAFAIASTAAQFFVQLRQHGAFEFLLSTPLSDAVILRGLWLALRNRFLPVAVIMIALNWLPGTSFRDLPSISGFDWKLAEELAPRLYTTVKSILLWLAAGWVGLYFGLVTRRTQIAGLVAGFFGVFLPWILWCVPDVISSLILLVVTRDQLQNRIRQTILAKIDAGQPL